MAGLFDIAGKRALITGGAQGVGRMIAERFVRGGVHAIVTSRKGETSRQAVESMQSFGDCMGLEADLSASTGAVALADKAWPDIISVNVQAPFTLVRELLPVLRASGTAADPARVINLGSYVGHAVERLPAYSYAASKAAIHHLTRVVAADFAASHITVNAVAPGYFSTRMTGAIDKAHMDALPDRIPLGRMGSAEDIAGACIYLASRAGAYLTGVILPIDGGMSGRR